jgi:hypothetical protein
MATLQSGVIFRVIYWRIVLWRRGSDGIGWLNQSVIGGAQLLGGAASAAKRRRQKTDFACGFKLMGRFKGPGEK